ncbi:hypothetical protein HDU87_003404 [Geranomyces variabilis]|uniref:Bromodomain-containing protein n=1 Tax=Geranomyces variabilis TaxID=109894 RepID=A0AAD5TPX7_9FUNG|nr:hypothetical protein HDU87_003404 [Geranomyces variabilis]
MDVDAFDESDQPHTAAFMFDDVQSAAQPPPPPPPADVSYKSEQPETMKDSATDLPPRLLSPPVRDSINDDSMGSPFFSPSSERPKTENGDQFHNSAGNGHSYPDPPSYYAASPAASPTQPVYPAVHEQIQQSPPHTQPISAHTPQPQSQALIQEQLKFCGNVIRNLKRLKDARPFLEPVDPVRLGIPTYFTLIKQPMDISTIEKKLRESTYASAQQFADDVTLMLQNCFTFNGRESPVGQNGQALERAFAKQMEKLPLESKSDKNKKRTSSVYDTPTANMSKRNSLSETRPKREIHAPARDISNKANGKSRMTELEIKFCSDVLRELHKKQHAAYNFPFLMPVDPIALNIPHYTDIIKNPMDLSTMRHKLDAGEYETIDEFAADAKLIFHNCYTFNPPGTEVYKYGQQLEEAFERKWAEKAAATAHAPRSARASKAKIKSQAQMHDFSDSESDEDESDAKQLQLLQQQLLAITTQMEMLQEKRKRRKRKSMASASHSHLAPPAKTPKIPKTSRAGKQGSSAYPPSSSKKTSAAKGRKQKGKHNEEDIPSLNYAQKEELSVLVGQLPLEKTDQVMDIIRSGSGLPENIDSGEIELDIESLDKSTLWSLYNYVKTGSSRGHYGKAARGSGTKGSRAKAKPKKGGPVGLSHNTDTSEGSESGSESGESESN